MTLSELEISLEELNNNVSALARASGEYVGSLRERAVRYISECRAAERQGKSDLPSLAYRHIALLYSSISPSPRMDISAGLRAIGELRAKATDLLSGGRLIDFFERIDGCAGKYASLSQILSTLYDDTLPRYLSRLASAADAGSYPAYSYEAPSAFITELDRIKT